MCKRPILLRLQRQVRSACQRTYNSMLGDIIATYAFSLTFALIAIYCLAP